MNERNYAAIGRFAGILCGLLALGFSDTARAQMVTLAPENGAQLTQSSSSAYALAMTVQQGGVGGAQIAVTTSENGTPVDSNVNIEASPAGSWLQVSPMGNPATPLSLQITVNGANLMNGTPVSGTITITPPQQPSAAVTLTVNVTVTSNSLLSSNPAGLSFSATVGTLESNVPTEQATISSSGAQLSYDVTATTQNGGNWLVPFTTSGTTGSSSTDVVTVGVNPAGLAVGSYQGSVQVQSTTTQDAVAIPVTLTITPGTTLSVTPSTLPPFLYQIGTTASPGQLTQTLEVSSNATSTPFEVTLGSPAAWLVVSPTSSATGVAGAAVPVTLQVSPTQLATMTAGVYSTTVIVSIPGGTPVAPIPVELVVSTNPLLSLSTNTLAFTSSFGATSAPPSQAVQVTTVGNSGTSVSFTVSSDSPWLTWTSPSLTTPGTITVSANPASLAVNTYTGHLTVKPNNSDANLYSLTITVTFTIGTVAQVSAGPPLLVFSWENTQSPPSSQNLELVTAGLATSFSLSTSSTMTANCPGNWLSASSNFSTTLNAIVTVSVNVTGMTPGACTGTVTVTYPANSSSPQTLAIPVYMDVSTSALLNINMPLGFGIVTTAEGANQTEQQITLTSTDPAVQVTDISASASSNGPSSWLFLGQNGSSTPQELEAIIQPGSLTPNTYGGTISISSSKLPASPLQIPISLTVTSNITVSIAPLTLSFNQPSGGPVPASQQVTLTSSAAGATFQTSIPSNQVCSWLEVSPSSGAASGPVTFSVLQNSLAQNSYTCPVTFSFLNSATGPITVNATLTVGPTQTLTVSPTSLTFAYQLGGSAPAAQQLTLTSTGTAVSFNASASSTGGWLSISPTSGTTGGSNLSQLLNVSVNPANIPPGTAGGSSLTGTITISASGVLATPITVNVTLNVAAAPAPAPVTITNSSQPSTGFGPIAPGEIITIRGTNLGPATCAAPATCISGGYSFTVGSNGTVSSTLGGVQVLFNTTPGIPTYVSATQINVIVPWEVATFASVNMVVVYNTVQSAAFPLQVASVAPGIYTQDATGAGQAAAVNLSSQAASLYNGPAGGTYYGTSLPTAPAPAGSAIVLYLTGGGLTNPALTDGEVTPSSPLYPLKNWTSGSSVVTATVGGQPATVAFAGAAPTLISGAVQVNLQLPAGVAGTVAVVVTIDGVQSNSVNIVVQ